MPNSFNGPSVIVETSAAKTVSIDGLVLDVNTGVLGNANTSYTYFDMALAGFNTFTLQQLITATTLTFEATNDLPNILDADAIWSDVTTTVSGSSIVTSYTVSGTVTVGAPFQWARVRVKRLTTNATNALELRLTRAKI